MANPNEAEHVVLVDEAARPIGTMPKARVHSSSTPLHLAFSCYLLDAESRILMTRRALSKSTWPGVWTNSLCGHPGPGEEIDAAIHRRAVEELGTTLGSLRPLLPDFRYRATDSNGIVENEVCPVYAAHITGPLVPEWAEVEAWEWVRLEDLSRAVASAPFAFSPWMIEQCSAGVLERMI